MHWFLCFAIYLKKRKMWFLVLNILWIFFQKKNYVVQSAEKELNLSGKGSYEKLGVTPDNPLNPNTGEHDSCLFCPVKCFLSSITLPDVVHVPDDNLSTSSHERYLKTSSFDEIFNEFESNPLMPFANDTLNELEDLDLLSDLGELTDELEKNILSNVMTSPESSKSQRKDNECTFNNPKGLDILSGLEELNDYIEEEFLQETDMPFASWDSSTMEKKVTDALKVLPEVASGSNNRSENISCYQVECYTENIPSVSGIQLKDLGFQHQVNVNNVAFTSVTSTSVTSTSVTSTSVTSTSVTSTSVTPTIVASTIVTSTSVTCTNSLEKNVITKRNGGDKKSSIFFQTSKYDIIGDKESIDINFIKMMIEKLVKDLELYKHVDKEELNAVVEEAIRYIGESQRDLNHIYIGSSEVKQLFKNVMIWVQKMKSVDHLQGMCEFLNSPTIFQACFACLLASYNKQYNEDFSNIKGKIMDKKSSVSEALESFINIDEPRTFVRLNGLLIFHNRNHNCLVDCVLKWVFCSVQEKSPFNDIHQKVNNCLKNIALLFAYNEEIANISEDERKPVHVKTQVLINMLTSYVTQMDLFMSALEDEQKDLIKEVAHRFTNVKEMATFLFYHVGKILLIILRWNRRKKSNFSFIMAVFSQLLIVCKNYINYESHLTKEMSTLLTEKEYLLQATFGNMFLCICWAVISQLKFYTDSTLNKINEETKHSGILNVNALLEKTKYLNQQVTYLKYYQFHIILKINNKIEQFEQYAPLFFRLNEINNKIRRLMVMVHHKNSNTRKKRLKENASTFVEIITDFNLLFQKINIQKLDEAKIEQLKIHVQDEPIPSSSSSSKNNSKRKRKNETSTSSSPENTVKVQRKNETSTSSSLENMVKVQRKNETSTSSSLETEDQFLRKK